MARLALQARAGQAAPVTHLLRKGLVQVALQTGKLPPRQLALQRQAAQAVGRMAARAARRLLPLVTEA